MKKKIRSYRAFIIVTAYFYSFLGASAILILSLMIRVVLADPGKDVGYVLSVTFFLVILGAAIPPLITLLLPAMAIFMAEKSSVRSWIYYVVAGALTGVAGIYTTRGMHVSDDHDDFYIVAVSLSLLAGITGGLIYWMLAGRNAGKISDEAGETKK